MMIRGLKNNLIVKLFIPIVLCPIVNLIVNWLISKVDNTVPIFSIYQALNCILFSFILTLFEKNVGVKKLVLINVSYSIMWPIIDLFIHW